MLVKISSKKKINCTQVESQSATQQVSQNRQSGEREIKIEYATADENIIVDGTASILRTLNIKPDVI